jgi:hypothetical protein
MEDFELKIRISPSEKEFRKLLGDEAYVKVKNDTYKNCRYICQGCGFHPLDEARAFTSLHLHVIEINEEKPEESKCNILCMACHSTQHIDVAIEREWVLLVNSTFSQKSLIENCRINAIHNGVQEDNTRFLKTPPKEFLEKLKAGEVPANNKVKVIFTNKFEWGDL